MSLKMYTTSSLPEARGRMALVAELDIPGSKIPWGEMVLEVQPRTVKAYMELVQGFLTVTSEEELRDYVMMQVAELVATDIMLATTLALKNRP